MKYKPGDLVILSRYSRYIASTGSSDLVPLGIVRRSISRRRVAVRTYYSSGYMDWSDNYLSHKDLLPAPQPVIDRNQNIISQFRAESN